MNDRGSGKCRGRERPDAGLTLIELVVAMAIFALVAVMGLQALTGAMRMRDRLVEIDTATAELGQTLALLRADLGAMVPHLFFPPDGTPRSALHLDRTGRVLSLSLAGQPDLPMRPGPGLQRIEWVLEPGEGRLGRRAWPALYPATAQSLSPQMELMGGVRGWSIRTYWPRLGWTAGVTGDGLSGTTPPAGEDGDAAPGGPAESYSGVLPLGIEVTLETARFGTIVLVESLQ